MNLSPDQLTWLAANKSGYELILMHSILHDRIRRTSMMGVPLVFTDFESPGIGAIWQGLILASSVMARMDTEMPYPPTVEQLKTYMYASTKEKESMVLEEDLDSGYKILEMLQSPERSSQWYYLDTYFPAWLSSVRVKGYARKAQMSQIADAATFAAMVDADIRKARSAIYSAASDDMYQAMYGTSEEGKVRRPTGFPAIDDATNGGWGDGECFALFAGTGGGKSVAAGQVGYHNAMCNGDTLILTTELPVVEYMVRIISNACHIKINLIQDCLNMGQVRQIIAATDPVALPRFEIALKIMSEHMRIVKLHPDQGLNARAIMELEVQRYEQQMGRKPTLVIFDWLGRIADVAATGSASDRTVAWERAADSCVQFSEISGIPALILLQAVNNAAMKGVLTQDDVGISKGVLKQMVMGFGITNQLDKAAIKEAALAGGLTHRISTTLQDQLFCIAKSRKGEGTFIPVKRDFLYQRFTSGRDR